VGAKGLTYAMSGWVQNLAECGCEYVERARNRVPLLNHAIQAVEPYVLPVFEVADLYFEAAFSNVSNQKQDSLTSSRCSAGESGPRRVESKLFRVSSTHDLLQLRHAPRDHGLVHRARQAATKMLSRLEAFVSNLETPDTGSKGSGSVLTLRQLGRCQSQSSFSSISDSVYSSELDDSASEMCFTTLEMIPRALILPVILQVQIMRMVVDKSSSLVCTAANFCGAVLQTGARHAARLSLHSACLVISRLGGCRRLSILRDGIFHRMPLARRALACLVDDGYAKRASMAESCQTPGETDGGTGCSTH